MISNVERKQITHRQHTVPQWHLRRFIDNDGHLWRYAQGKPPKRSQPKSECWEPDFYEYDVNGKTTNNRYEDFLTVIENDAAARFQVLLDRQQLSREDAPIWASYVASLFVRSPKYRLQVSAAMVRLFGEQTRSPDYIRTLQHELLKKGELVFAEDLQKDTHRLRGAMERSPSFYHVVGLERATASISKAILQKTWHILNAAAGCSFLMSDCPVSTIELVDGRANPGVGFANEHVAIFLPLTPHHVFVAGHSRAPFQSVADIKSVESLNRLTVHFANKAVYAHVNSPDVKVLVDSEIGRVVFGGSAFLPPNPT